MTLYAKLVNRDFFAKYEPAKTKFTLVLVAGVWKIAPICDQGFNETYTANYPNFNCR